MIRRTTRTIHTLIIGLTLAGCGVQSAPTSPALTPRPTSAPAAQASPVAASPVATQEVPGAPTPAAIPTAPASTQEVPATAQPTAAGSADAAWPEPTATPAFPEQQITAANVGQVELLRTVGFGQAQDAAFSPDQRLLAVATSGGVAWYALPGLRHLRFDPIEGGVDFIRFIDSQTIEIIASPLSGDDRVELRRVVDGGLIESRSQENAEPIWSQTVDSPRGDIQARFLPPDSVPTPGVTITRLADSTTLYEDTETLRIDFAADGSSLAVVTANGTVRIIDLLTNHDKLRAVALPGYSAAAFSPDGQTLVTSGWDLTLWDVVSGEQVQRQPMGYTSSFGPSGTTQRILFSPDGGVLTVDGAYAYFESEVRVGSSWTVSTGAAVDGIDTPVGGRGIINHSTYVGAVSPAGYSGAFSSDGTTLEIHRAGALLHTLTWAEQISGLAFSPDGATLAVGDKQGGLRLVAVEDGSVGEALGTASKVRRFAFSPDGTTLAVAGDQGAVKLVELITVSDGSIRGKISLGEVAQLSFSPDSTLLAARSVDGAIRMINAAAPEDSHEIPAEEGSPPSQIDRMVFTTDNILLVSDASGVRFYTPETRLLHTLPATGDDIAIGPNRRLLLVLRDGYVQLWGIRE